MSPEPEWIEERTVRLFHQRQLAEHGGMPGIRDENMLTSALAKPQQLWCYGSPPPDICHLAAAYAYGLLSWMATSALRPSPAKHS